MSICCIILIALGVILLGLCLIVFVLTLSNNVTQKVRRGNKPRDWIDDVAELHNLS